MKVAVAAIAAALAMGTIAGPAAAQRMGVNGREANLERRIDMGVRNGSLTRREAYRLRMELRGINRLEWRYRRNGLSRWERQDLNRRMNLLSARVRYDRHDWQNRRWRR